MTKMVDGVAKSVVDPKATARAQMQMEKLKTAFQSWLWKNPQRAQNLCDIYNRKFNNIRPREYDGSFLTFPGMNPTIQLQPHQKDAIAHALFGGNTLRIASGQGKPLKWLRQQWKPSVLASPISR